MSMIDADVLAAQFKKMMETPLERKAAPLDSTYLFSEKARRALFFARYNASLRNTDEVTHHITLDDLLHGIERGRRPPSTKVGD